MASSNAAASSMQGNKRIKPRILIVGIGNALLQDDGVGVHAVRELIKDPPSGVMCVEVGTAVLDALHLIEWADKIEATLRATNYLRIELEHKSQNTRKLHIENLPGYIVLSNRK